ncbi:GtrA family protein [Acutalibacter caecimuris]|uniref:GtrA family protein n=1 Tax=Acutalibacter caecimuris TaxID=3093657 RepID=UPI002AC9DA8F|nr:GtrA family protein [Acutalibacter sp. M00118]
MRALLTKYRELILYVFFGVLTTLVNWVCYWLLADVLRLHYMGATFLAQVLAILFAYVTNRRWVFESKVTGLKGIAGEMAKFFAARGVSLVMDMLFMYVGVDLLCINDKAVKVVSSVAVIVANYVFSKLFVFRK